MRLCLLTGLFFFLTAPSVGSQLLQTYDNGVRHEAALHLPSRSGHSSTQQSIQLNHYSVEKQPYQQQNLEALAELRGTLDILQSTWYDLSRGTWPTSIDWTGAVLNTHLVASVHTLIESEDTHELDNLVDYYFAQTAAYYYGEHAASLRQQAYDDMLWVVLSWLESIKFIDARSRSYQHASVSAWHGQQFISVFARRAKSFYNITLDGWSRELCGGGMTWNPALEPYKNAITNELFISASVGMYLYFPEHQNASSSLASRKRFLTAAIDGYDWLARSNMTNKQGLFVDGFHIDGWSKNGTGGTACNNRNEMVYTYNQGVILSGLRGLWEATGNTTYLYDAHRLTRCTVAATGWILRLAQPSNDTAWHGLGRFGILEEYCDALGACDQDAHMFKSIYFHHLGLFCQPLPKNVSISGSTIAVDNDLRQLHHRSCRTYRSWVLHNAHAALSTRDRHGRIGTWWGATKNIPEPARLPHGAIDYRNGARGRTRIDSKGESADRRRCQSAKQSLMHVGQDRGPIAREPIHHRDWNDRGRGRTVESHSGGVAVLRCLYEMQIME